MRPLPADLSSADVVRIHKRLPPNPVIQESEQECVSAPSAHSASKQLPELGKNRVDGPQLFAVRAEHRFGALGSDVTAIVGHHGSNERARVREDHDEFATNSS